MTESLLSHILFSLLVLEPFSLFRLKWFTGVLSGHTVLEDDAKTFRRCLESTVAERLTQQFSKVVFRILGVHTTLSGN